MKIDCVHGYYKFTEIEAGQLSSFISISGLDIARAGDHFTFTGLIDAPDYSIPGGTFLGAPTTETYEGDPWDVMRENGLVYLFNLGLVVPITTVVQPVSIVASGNFFVSTGMILPGSVTEDGLRVSGYSGFFIRARMNFKYSEITYVETA